MKLIKGGGTENEKVKRYQRKTSALLRIDSTILVYQPKHIHAIEHFDFPKKLPQRLLRFQIGVLQYGKRIFYVSQMRIQFF